MRFEFSYYLLGFVMHVCASSCQVPWIQGPPSSCFAKFKVINYEVIVDKVQFEFLNY